MFFAQAQYICFLAAHDEQQYGMRFCISILLITCTALAACSNEPPSPSADIVMLNGGIYTVDADRRWAEAVAIRSGMIVAVGTNSEIETYVGNKTEVIDLTGRMAMPGIHDSHVHPLEGAYEQIHCNLWEDVGIDAILAKLQACDKNHDGEWFEAVGLDLSSFGLSGPDKSILDGLAQEMIDQGVKDAEILMELPVLIYGQPMGFHKAIELYKQQDEPHLGLAMLVAGNAATNITKPFDLEVHVLAGHKPKPPINSPA